MLKLPVTILFWLIISRACSLKYEVIKNARTGATEINITSSVITITKDLFVNLSALESLTMVNVNVKNLGDNCFGNLPNLHSIKLSKNQISRVPKNVFSNTDITYINLASNKINDIAEYAFENTEKLNWLDLSNNLLSKINAKWFKNTGIELLDLQNNHLMRIYKADFKELKKPYYFDISFNQIHFIEEGTFSDYNPLTYLDVRGNSLTNLNFLTNTYIDELQVSLNRLANLKLEPSTTVKEIGIYPNPFRCKQLEAFWKSARMRGMKIRSANNNVIRWDNKYPVCVNDRAVGNSSDREEKLNDLYFSVVDYSIINIYKQA